ncbi:HD domain-containing protein [Jannaschia sp. KMU-145]|uniref:HD domain-containing protein n=1 Tax=Jannaschia halovivens TaxID=3388667 RepID=UPI00396B471C
MGDKTQVFPLESIESIRTRLTHSYEVANLARSLGVEIAHTLSDKLPEDAIRVLPAALAAVGLAHDIGNPPFGHQGEFAIRA